MFWVKGCGCGFCVLGWFWIGFSGRFGKSNWIGDWLKEGRWSLIWFVNWVNWRGICSLWSGCGEILVESRFLVSWDWRVIWCWFIGLWWCCWIGLGFEGWMRLLVWSEWRRLRGRRRKSKWWLWWWWRWWLVEKLMFFSLLGFVCLGFGNKLFF